MGDKLTEQSSGFASAASVRGTSLLQGSEEITDTKRVSIGYLGNDKFLRSIRVTSYYNDLFRIRLGFYWY